MASIPGWAVLLVVIGIPLACWPYRVTLLHETIDAIGRRSAGPVEPADWYVSLTRVGGIAFLLVGGAAIVWALL